VFPGLIGTIEIRTSIFYYQRLAMARLREETLAEFGGESSRIIEFHSRKIPQLTIKCKIFR